jgi:hypothetical protein
LKVGRASPLAVASFPLALLSFQPPIGSPSVVTGVVMAASLKSVEASLALSHSFNSGPPDEEDDDELPLLEELPELVELDEPLDELLDGGVLDEESELLDEPEELLGGALEDEPEELLD